MSRYAIQLCSIGLVVTLLLISFLMHRNEISVSAASERAALSELFVKRLGEPDSTSVWKGTVLEYQIGNGRVFAISIDENEKIWAGYKVNLQLNVGKIVTLPGRFMGPGRPSNYVYTRDGQEIYIQPHGIWRGWPANLRIGDAIHITGLLRFDPGSDSGSTMMQSRAACYYIDDPTITPDTTIQQ